MPNLASTFGYTNASWTLKCDLTCEYVCRLLNHMDRRGYAECHAAQRRPDLDAGALARLHLRLRAARASTRCPKQGSKAPWRLYQNYALDLMALRYGAVDDGTMEFKRREPAKRAA